MAHVSKRHPEAAAALLNAGKVEVTKTEEGRDNWGKANEIPGKASENPGRASFIKLRVPSKERGNGNNNRPSVGNNNGWHTSVVCAQCDYMPTSETDLKNHVQIAHVENHEEQVAGAGAEAEATATTPQGMSTVRYILRSFLSFPSFVLVLSTPY